MLRAGDGVPIEAAYEPFAGSDTGADVGVGTGVGTGAVVLAHGFAGAVDRPALRRAVAAFARHTAVVSFSFRGHGRSGGHSTVGDREVLDLAAAVRWARSLGHGHVTTVGFSMGGSVVVRHGALYRTDSGPEWPDFGGRWGRPSPDPSPGPHADAVVAVSAAARWYYRGTAPMRRLHWAVQRPLGRLVSRYGLRTRVRPRGWDTVPLSPVDAAPSLAPVPLLVVHGDQDPYFPLDHPRSLAAAGDPQHTRLWLVRGFGHAENAAEPALLHRIGTWAGARREEVRREEARGGPRGTP